MELSDSNDQLLAQLKDAECNLEAEMKENKKLKEVMETMLKNRKIVEEEVSNCHIQVEYTHKRYKKILQEK